MLNPYVLLGLVIFYFVSIGVAGYAGYDYRDGKVAKEKLDAVNAAVSEHNENAEIDKQAAFEWGESNAKVRTKYVEIRSAAAAVTAATPTSNVCALDTERWRLLNLAISIASAGKGSPDSLPVASPKADAASKPVP